ncbi:hypothetical protein [Sphingobacterium siyangense]|uniref:hypothetical protein n=1 Tax=Sphingobacterium siyangense TaxID=459529 RepID=UPI003DA6AF1F
MTLIYIIIATVFITVIVKIVLFVIKHDRAPYIPTLDEVFPDQKEDIPLEEFEQMKKRLIQYLIAWGMDERAEIDKEKDTKDTAFLFHYSDPAWDAIFLWSIADSSREYLKASSDPTIEEFATLFIKSNYEEIAGIVC